MSVRWKDKSDIGALAAGDRIPVTDVSAADVDKYFTPAEMVTYCDGFFLTPAEGDALFLTSAEGSAAYQPLDADLTELAALRAVAVIHAFNFQNYR